MKKCEILIYILCVVLFLFACVSLGAGVYLMIAFDSINRDILPTFDDAREKIQKMFTEINRYPGTKIENPPSMKGTDPLSDIQLRKIFQGFGFYFTALSFVLAVLGIATLASVCRKKKLLTKVCITLTVCLLLIETSSLLLHTSFRKLIHGLLRDFFAKQLNFSFKSLRSNDSVSVGWNLIMQKFNCCGIDGYDDFNSSTSFEEEWGEPAHTRTTQHLFVTALACCNRIYVKLMPRDERFNGPCYEKEYTTKKGCLAVFWDVADNYKMLFIAGVAVVMLIQVLLVVANCVVLKVHHKALPSRVTTMEQSANTRKVKNGRNKIDNFDTRHKNSDKMNMRHDNAFIDPTGSYSRDFRPHKSSSNDNITKHMAQPEIKENSWMQDFSSKVDQRSNYDFDYDEPNLKEKWYTGRRELPVQRPKRF